MPKSIVGLFENEQDAQAAERALERAGVRQDNATVVQQPTQRLSSNLVKAGISEQDANLYTDEVHQGGTLLVVQAVADHQAEQVARILDRHNVVNISRRAPSQSRIGLDRFTNDRNAFTNIYEGDEIVIPIIEEELIIRKEEVERGGVRVDVDVKEVPVSQQVTVRDESVQVQRRPVDRPISEADVSALQDNTLEVRETDQEVVTDKQARVVEEMHISKDIEERTEVVQDTLRRTVVDVKEIDPSTDATSSGTTSDDRRI